MLSFLNITVRNILCANYKYSWTCTEFLAYVLYSIMHSCLINIRAFPQRLHDNGIGIMSPRRDMQHGIWVIILLTGDNGGFRGSQFRAVRKLKAK